MLNDGRSAKLIQCFDPNSNVLHTSITAKVLSIYIFSQPRDLNREGRLMQVRHCDGYFMSCGKRVPDL